MKKTGSMVLLVVSCLLLAVSLVLCVYSVYDINCKMDELANNPSVSGIDYLGLGWGYGTVLFIPSVLGLILSCITKKVQQQSVCKSIAFFTIIAFLALIVASVYFIRI